MNIPVTTTTTGVSSSSVANATTTTTSISTDTSSTTDNNNEDLEGINLADPEEIHAHLQVLDVRQRLRRRRKRMIQLFSVSFVGIAIYFFIRLELFNNNNANNSDTTTTNSGSSSSSTTKLLPQPPADLASKCSLATLNKPNGIEICEEACEISDCCNIPTDYALSCNNKQNEIVCARYQRYCDILHNLPENLQQQQSSSSSSNNSDNQQQQQESSSSANDIDGDDDASSPTTPIVNNNPSLTIQEQISQACNKVIEGVDSPSTGEETTCENICSPSVCCFNHLCNPPPDINCNEYVQCHNLYDDLDTIDDDQLANSEEGEGSEYYPTLQEEIANSCQNINLIPIAKSECEAICAIGSCCFIQDLVCPTTDVDCQEYQGCNVLYDNNNDGTPPPPAIPGTTSPTSSPIVVASPTPAPAKPPSGTSGTSLTAEEVNDACNNHNDNALIRPTLCEQVCTLQVVQCCFHYSSNNNVAAEGGCDEIPCNVYEACEVLGNNPEYLREVHIQELNEACNNDATRNHCVQLCAPASCCYATTIDEECIHVDTAITCSDYEACNVLYQNSNNNNINNGNAGGIGGGSDSGLGAR